MSTNVFGSMIHKGSGDGIGENTEHLQGQQYKQEILNFYYFLGLNRNFKRSLNTVLYLESLINLDDLFVYNVAYNNKKTQIF